MVYRLSSFANLFKMPELSRLYRSSRFLLFLLISNGSFFVNVYSQGAGTGNELNWSILEVADTLYLYVGGKPAGRLFHEISVDTQDRIVQECTSVKLGSGGMHVDEISQYDWDGKLRKAFQEIQSPAGKNSWSLEKNGKGKWVLDISAGGVSTKKEIEQVHSDLYETRKIMEGILGNTVKEGDTWHDTIFSLTSGKNVPVTTTCKKIPGSNDSTWVFVNRDELTQTDEEWEVDREGRMVRTHIPPMFIARREKIEEKSGPEGELAVDQISEMFHIPAGPHTNGRSIVVSGDSSFQLHPSVKQFYKPRVKGFVLRSMPSSCDDSNGNDSVAGRFLEATPTMQVDADPVVYLADSLGRDLSQRCSIIERVWEYVYHTIEKRNVATFSSALETLRAGYGDCGEHAVTMAAILRAALIPSRVVLGLVYLGGKKGYFYHAWVMVWDGNRWIFVDPALGRLFAVRGYIPLVIDDTGEDAVYLTRYVGKLRVSYIESNHDSE